MTTHLRAKALSACGLFAFVGVWFFSTKAPDKDVRGEVFEEAFVAEAQTAHTTPASNFKPRALEPRASEVLMPAVLVPFAETERGAALASLLGEGPLATAYLASFLASEHVSKLAGGAATRDAIVDGYRGLLEANPAAVWSYVRERTSQGRWEGFEQERYLLVASAFESLPTESGERAHALEWLSALVGNDSGPSFVTGVALLAARLGSEEEALQVGHALLAGRESASDQAHVVSLLSGSFPEAANRFHHSFTR